MWAIFSDNIPQIKSELILDEDATASNIRNAICGSLVGASEDDVVIISFSGHGSEDHNIVAHDTDLAHFLETSISMSEIAESFRVSKARAIVFFLDCCFSGDATSKVLDGGPTPRSHENPFRRFDGKGRILLAASNYDEPAYELPSTGHGLLTKAIIDTLLASNDSTSITQILDEVMRRVRGKQNWT